MATDEGNYVEAVMLREETRVEDEDAVAYSVHFSEREAQAIFDAYQRAHRSLRPTSRHYIAYLHDDMELTRAAHDHSPYLTRMQLLDSAASAGHVVNTYRRMVVPAFAFPSTDELVEVVDVKHTGFNLGDGVVANFDSCAYSDGVVANHVYVSAKLRPGSDARAGVERATLHLGRAVEKVLCA